MKVKYVPACRINDSIKIIYFPIQVSVESTSYAHVHMSIIPCVCSCHSYHTGSLAFGSLILAVVQMVRIVLEYLDHKLKGKL